MIKVDKVIETRVCQGDIIKNVEFIEYADEVDGQLEISKITFPLVVVLTQDCDLEQDFNNRSASQKASQDKHLISIIVAPLYNIEHLYDGEHLSELGLKMQVINRKPEKSDNKFLRQNQNPRYHYFEFPSELGVVNSAVDFKHYFTVNLNYLTKHKVNNFVCKISELYRESVSHRFSFYLSRIGLPNQL